MKTRILRLEFAAEYNPGTTNWVNPSENVNNDGTNNFILVNAPIAQRFYRLFYP